MYTLSPRSPQSQQINITKFLIREEKIVDTRLATDNVGHNFKTIWHMEDSWPLVFVFKCYCVMNIYLLIFRPFFTFTTAINFINLIFFLLYPSIPV